MGSTDQKLMQAYSKVYKRRLNKLGIDETMFSNELHLPEVAITDREKIPLVTDQESLSFQITALDELSNLDRIHIYVNSVPVYGSYGLPVRGEGNSVSRDISLQLNPGKNKIQVSCLNERGVESHQETFEIICRKPESKPDLYMITVCVSEYADPAMNLNYAAKDGRDMVKLYASNQDLFGNIHLDTLFNSEALKENFLQLKDKLYKSDIDDQVIIFMAGHGVLDQNFDFNFATHNIDPDNPSVNGISFSNIEFLVDSIPARKKLVLIDACHSGEIDKQEIEETAQQVLAKQTTQVTDEESQGRELKSQSFQKLKMNVFNFYGVNNSTIEMMEEMFNTISKGSGSVVISAAAGNSYALESAQWDNGVFTFSILDGLENQKADLNKDGEVTVTELKDYVTDSVFKMTNGQQKPTSRKENLDFDFTIWK